MNSAGVRRIARWSAIAAFVGSAAFSSGQVGAAGYSISHNPAQPTVATGVYFTVSTGGGNREFASVAVSCTDGASEVYATVLTVEVPPKGTGTSQTVVPPASSCRADLIKQMQIGKARVLASTSFTVSP